MHPRILWLLLLLAGRASADPGRALPLPASGRPAPGGDAAAFQDEMGTLRLILFAMDPPRPLAGVRVRVGNVALGRTNEDGALETALFGGLYHITFDISDNDTRTEALRVIPGESTEVLLGAPPGTDALLAQVEQSLGAPSPGAGEGGAAAGPLSSIDGVVTAAETGRPVADARIFVRGLTVEARTDASGRFSVPVPAGRHDIVMVHPEYSTATRRDIAVAADRPAAVAVEAEETAIELTEVTVTAPRITGSEVTILRERREATQVSDIIGAAQLGKSGDSTAAAALKRVTGVTIVDGKYVYVRGLGERYSSTTLNGLNLPSPDPERRVVPLDMIPAEILDSVKIQKSYSPEMPGDFGGGAVNLRTRGYPPAPLLKLSLSGGVNLGSTCGTADFTADQGPTDILGIDGGHRALPGNVADALEGKRLIRKTASGSGYSLETLSALTREMPESWGVTPRRIPPDIKVTATAGNGWRAGRGRFGFLASLLYENEWDTSHTYKATYSSDGGLLVPNKEYFIDDTVNTLTLGGILTLGADLGEDHQLRLNTLVNRITDNDFYRYEAYLSDFDARVYNYAWIERMLIAQQLLGSHTLPGLRDLKVDWRYGFARAGRLEPDKRFVRYDYNDPERTTLALSTMNNASRRDHLQAWDQAHDLGLDLALPFEQWSGAQAAVKAGGAVTLRSRKTDIRRLAYANISTIDETSRQQPPWELFTDANEGPDGLRLLEVTQGTDNYAGELAVYAAYLSSDLPLGAGFSASGGLRFEKAAQTVSTIAMFTDDDTQVSREFDTMDLLPALVLTYALRDGMLLRLGYGKTLNRPDFKEMSPGCSMTYAGTGDICGAPKTIANPEWTPEAPVGIPSEIPYTLKPATIHNVDARFEWYFSEVESLSFGAFFKAFVDPIESVFAPSTDDSTQLRNARSARNLGVELMFHKGFGFASRHLADLFIAGNAAWIHSRISIPEAGNLNTNNERPLQGQSPFVVNARLGYDNVDLGLSAMVLYNVFGRRIATVGISGLQDIYEQPFHQLDVVIKAKLGKGFELGLKAVNLLDWSVRYTQAEAAGGPEHTTLSTKKGRALSLSLSWQYH